MSANLRLAADALGVTPAALGLDDDARRSELAAKLARVAAWLATQHADALWLRRAENLAWITGGGDLLVHREGAPIADAVVLDGELIVVTNHIEAARLADEELPPGTHVEAVPWHAPGARRARVAEMLHGRAWRDDDADLTTLRQPLLGVEQARLAAIGAAASRALTDAGAGLTPATTERGVAAHVHGALRAAGVDLPVTLVAGDARFGHVRHPVPTDRPFGRVGLIVVCAQRFGLVASLSRIVAFDDVPDPVQDALERVWRVEAAMLAASRPGAATHAVLAAAQAAYAAEGVPDAWQDHHQGGPAGYTPRAWLATPGEARPLRAGMALAWNPSLPWAKSEDTFLLGGDGVADADLTNLTWDPRWPHVLVAGRPRAAVRVL